MELLHPLAQLSLTLLPMQLLPWYVLALPLVLKKLSFAFIGLDFALGLSFSLLVVFGMVYLLKARSLKL
eukprot:8223109-Alexandrium_andersonii.AAC.1